MTGNLEFMPLVHDSWDFQGDHHWERVQEVTITENGAKSTGETNGTTVAKSTTRTQSFSESQNESESDGAAESKVYGPTGLVASVTKSNNMGDGKSKGSSFSVADGESTSRGESKSTTTTATEGWAKSVGEKLVPLPVIVHNKKKTGSLEVSISDQIDELRQRLHGLEDRHAIVLAPRMTNAVEIVTVDVPDPFQSPAAQAKAVKWIANAICEAHVFYFVPSFDPADQDERVQRFVEGAPEKPEETPTISEPSSAPPPTIAPAPAKRTVGNRPMIDAPPGKKIPFGE